MEDAEFALPKYTLLSIAPGASGMKFEWVKSLDLVPR